MKNKPFVPAVLLIVLTVGFDGSARAEPPKLGLSLNEKMFTLSAEDRISFFPPYFSGKATVSPNNGVSVCLHYMAEYLQTESPSIFTLSPSTDPLKLEVLQRDMYNLSRDLHNSSFLILQPSVRFLSDSQSDIWTRLCLTVDSRRNLVQVFSGLKMSIRKFLPDPYVWSGEPVISFSGFDGHFTDVQVWNCPLSYHEVYKYMSGSGDRPRKGSVLSWSNISYSIQGNALLEDTYVWVENWMVGRRGSMCQPK
ncbi:hypothetical protein Q5P01_001195 [Channa striata]|uniref:Pentraxin (PTX) domain-containing protein n=1 Tax=Channa striata TaxID=64152 RepID=A0AA88T3Q1_CHASR|nr:hypothetical protein Q5P01_001195 [Channa striata]